MQPPAFEDAEPAMGGTLRPDSGAAESLDSPLISKTVDPRRLSRQDADRLHTLTDTKASVAGPSEPSDHDTMHSSPGPPDEKPAMPQGDEEGSLPTQDWGDTGESSGTWSHLVIQPRRLTETDASESDTRPDYEVLDELGHGAMGVVYRARQASVNRIVAVKMLNSTLANDDHQRGLFLGEAVVTGELEHPNIVPIYDLAKSQSDALFYSMKEVKGTPWSKVVADKSLSENLEIWLRVSDAIAFAHDRGVIHRDLKPENVMLGRFGEVLVMDWGIAVSRSMLQNPVIAESNGQGGTPAYMAPEMAKEGPLSRVGTAADIYLLGALLYEIVTGNPPHTGKDIFTCLLAAARNRIVETDKEGELVDIARKAMSTLPEDRYGDVEELQEAVRGYLSHAESIALTDRGCADLQSAEKSGDYNEYQQAILALREAVALWSANQTAEAELARAREACARLALRRGDYDLGLSVLDAENPDHRGLISSLKAKRRRRRGVRALIAALVAVIIVGTTLGSILIYVQWQNAVSERARAESEAKRAREQEQIAVDARDEAIRSKLQEQQAKEKERKAKDVAIKLRDEADAARKEAEDQRNVAQTERDAAAKARDAAEKAKDAAEEARAEEVVQRKLADFASYRAQIALAKSQIDSNVFNRAKAELVSIETKARDSGMFQQMPWEYRRLRYMLELSKAILPIESPFPIHQIAFAPDGKSFAIAGQSNQVSIWSSADAQLQKTIQTEWNDVSGLTFLDSQRLVTVSNGRIAGAPPTYPTEITTWDTAAWTSVDSLISEDELQILSVVPLPEGGFITGSVSRSQAYMYSPFAPGVVQQWLPTEEREKIVTHYGAVVDLALSPDAQVLVSVDEFGQAIICQREPDGGYAMLRGEEEPFEPHEKSSIHAAAFSPDGKWLATAGSDGRILLWLSSDLIDPEVHNIELRPTLSLVGHESDVFGLGFSSDSQQIVSGGDDGTVRVWDVAAGEQRMLLRGHSNSVRACVFNPVDANVIVSGDLEGEVRIWDQREYREMLDLRHERLPEAIDACFSPDGRRIAVAHRSGTGHGATAVWEIDDRDGRLTTLGSEPVILDEGHTMPTCYAFATPWGDEERLVTLAQDAARFWDIQRGRQLHCLRRVKIPMNFGNASLALSNRGDWLIAPSSERLAAGLWCRTQWDDQDDPQPMQYLEPHMGTVEAVAIASDASHLFSGDDRRLSLLWRANATAKKYEEYAKLPWGWATNGATAALFLPDGSRVLAVDAYMVRQFDIRSGKELSDARIGSANQGKAASIALTPDAKFLMVATDSGWLSVWDIRQQEKATKLGELPPAKVSVPTNGAGESGDLRTIDRVITSVAVSDDGSKVMDVSSADSSIRISNLTSDGALEPARTFRTPGYQARSASFYTADGSQIFTAGEARVILWDVTADEPKLIRVFGAAQVTNSVEFSADGQRVVTAHGDGQAIVWDLSKRLVHCHTAGGHAGGAQDAQFSGDGKSIYTAGADGRVKTWDADTGAAIGDFCRVPGDYRVNAMAISNQSSRLATASEDGKIIVWNMQTGDQVYELSNHAGPATCVAYSTDGQWLISGGVDQAAYLWKADGQGQPFELKGHTKRINSVAFTPDGRRVITSSDDGTAKLWVVRYNTEATDTTTSIASVDELLTFKQEEGEVVTALLSPDSRNLLTAGRNGQVLIRPSVHK